MNKKLKSALFISLTCLSYSTFAATVNIEMRGELIQPSCNINNGQQIDIDFGKLDLNLITSGSTYGAQTRQIDLNCPGTDLDKMHIAVGRGSSSHFTGYNNVLQTAGVNFRTLGIAFFEGSTVGNHPIEISNSKPGGVSTTSYYGTKVTPSALKNGIYTFTVAPWNVGGLPLKPGVFAASTTIMISYL